MTEIDMQINPGERLKAIRDEIDKIDEQIILLWAQRNQLAAEAGTIKRYSGGTVYSHARDNEVRERFVDLGEQNGIPRDLGRLAIGTLMSASYAVQRQPIST